MLRVFRVTYQRIISKCQVSFRSSDRSASGESWRSLCSQGTTLVKMRTLAHVVLGQTNKNTEGQFIYFLLFHYTPQAHHGPYVGIVWNCPRQKQRLRLFSSKDSYTRDCLTVHPWKIPTTGVRGFDNLMLALVECFQPNKTKFPVKIPSQDWDILTRTRLVKTIEKSSARPEGELCILASTALLSHALSEESNLARRWN